VCVRVCFCFFQVQDSVKKKNNNFLNYKIFWFKF
jgi:hypothetical protein